MNSEKKDARKVYADIIDLPHYQSTSRKHMSLYNRAAQFAPFSALSGYGEMVQEEARLTDHETELSEDQIEYLNRQLTHIARVKEQGSTPIISITYFVPDSLKSGGRYLTTAAKVRTIDRTAQKIVLSALTHQTENRHIPLLEIDFRHISDIHILCFD